VRRRELLLLLGGATMASRAVSAQHKAMPVIGWLTGTSPESDQDLRLPGFRQGLDETGYVEGRNVAIEYRWAEGHNDRLSSLAADLVRRQVTVIVTGATPAALAAKATTSTIPIVFSLGTDPVQLGLIASLNEPGGNITGVVNLSVDLTAKRLDLLHELAPTAASVALLVNPTNPATDPIVRNGQDAARFLGLQLLVLQASIPGEIDAAFRTVVERHAGALVAGDDPLFTARRDQIVALAARHAVPAIYAWREFVTAGGLMSYGSALADMHHQAGVLAGKILKGAKPAELPVEQAVRVGLVVNLKTATALGLTMPQALLGRADEVIE
jgi:putative ABC transport system substrate-binding protein